MNRKLFISSMLLIAKRDFYVHFSSFSNNLWLFMFFITGAVFWAVTLGRLVLVPNYFEFLIVGLMVLGVYGQHRQNLARAQAKTAIDQPEQAVAQGGLAQRQALKQAGRLGADHRQARHPIDHGLRTWCVLDAQRPS